MTYSEREREFMFAKNRKKLGPYNLKSLKTYEKNFQKTSSFKPCNQ